MFLLSAHDASAVEQGQPLVEALDELRRGGLQLIFSSSLIDSSSKVNVVPGGGSHEQIARRILAPYGLTLSPIRPGIFGVVRDRAHASSPASTPSDPAPVTQEADSSTTPLFEIQVYASRYQLDQQQQSAALAELTRTDLDVRPGVDQDALRVTRYLPGTASTGVSARSHIRGGRQDEVAVFFDGAPLFEPFHFKDLYGLFGVLDPSTISTLDFFSGVFPVRYGNRVSGVLDIQPRTYSGEDYHEIGVSMLYTHLLTQGRLESKPVEWLASVRWSNLGLITEALGREEVKPDFLDALGRVQLDTGDRSSLAAGWLHLTDKLTTDLSHGEEVARFDHRDTTSWLSWDFEPDSASQIRAVASHTERHTDRTGTLSRMGSSSGNLRDRRRFDTTSLRLEGGVRFSDRLRAHMGAEAYDYRADYQHASEMTFDPLLAAALGRPVSGASDLDFNLKGRAYAAYGSTLLSLTDSLSLDLGVRWDTQRYAAYFEDAQVSPRLSLQFGREAGTVVRLSWGRFAQAERPDELLVQDGDAAFHSTQRATQTVLSLERPISSEAHIRVETFDKRVSDPRPEYENLLNPFSLLPELEVDRVRIEPHHSRAYGAEMILRWEPRETWGSWMSYSWSEVTDRFADSRALRAWDQKHSVATGASWTRAPWQLSGNVTWHSGWRRNTLQLEDQDGAPVIERSPLNAESWPEYFSLDLRATWKRALRRGALEVFAEVNNLTQHRNLCCSEYRLDTSAGGTILDRETTVWLPRYVLAGVTWQLP